MYEQTNDQTSKYYVYGYLRANASTNGAVGSIYYVGKGTGKRAFDKGHGVRLPKDKRRIVFVAENLNEADAFQLEILLINLHGRIDLGTGILRNLTNGGDGSSGWVASDETRKKMSLVQTGRTGYWLGKTGDQNPHTGKKLSDATKAKLSLAHTGKKLSEVHKANMSLGLSGEKCYWYGKTLSDEHRKKLSLAKTGQKNSPETRAKLSSALAGKSKSPEHVAKIALALTGKKRAPFSPEARANMALGQLRRHAAKCLPLAA